MDALSAVWSWLFSHQEQREEATAGYSGLIDWSANPSVTGNTIDRNVLAQMMRHLEPEELGSCLLVSRSWRIVATNELDWLWKRCRELCGDSMFGRAEWINYAGDIGNIPPPSRAKIKAFEDWQDPTAPPLLFYMPQKVDRLNWRWRTVRADWTLDRLRRNTCRGKSPNGYGVEVASWALGAFGYTPVAEAGWLVVQRRQVRCGRDGLLPEEMKSLQAIGARQMTILEATTLLHALRQRTGAAYLVKGERYGSQTSSRVPGNSYGERPMSVVVGDLPGPFGNFLYVCSTYAHADHDALVVR